MKHYILNCICAALITLLFTLSFKFTPYQTLILYFVMLTSFEIRNFIDNNKKQWRTMKYFIYTIVKYLIAIMAAIMFCSFWASTNFEIGVITLLTFIYVSILDLKD